MGHPESLGKYEVIRPLGQGGFGAVYLCQHPELSVLRAVKLLREDLAPGQQVAEAVLQARLEHEHIVRVIDVGLHGSRPYLVMEYVDGGDLAGAIAEGLTLDRALLLARQLAEALNYAHGQGVIHRDLKPANVLLTGAGQVKVADFGLARLVAPRSGEAATKVAGTVPYLAPEQLKGRAGKSSDMWALGCLLYQMLAGRPPFGESDDFATMQAIAGEEPPPLSQAPPLVASLLNRLLAKDPNGRPDAAGALASLKQALAAPAGGGAVRAATVEADDWPTFRGGPGRTGCRLGRLSPPLEVAWEYQAQAPVLSSPAICRGRAFLGDNSGMLHCLDLLSGTLAWSFSGQGPAFPGPAAAGTAVVAATGEGWVYALSAVDGALIWQSRLSRPLAGTPLVLPGGVFVGDLTGQVHQLDPVDGAPRGVWSADGPLEASLLAAGEDLVWASGRGQVAALDPSGRSLRWSRDLGAAVESSPAAQGGRLYCLSQAGRLLCLDQLSGEVLWSRELEQPAVATPAVDQSSLAVATLGGLIALLDPADGKELWRRSEPTAYSASPLLCREHLALAGRDGRLLVLDRGDGQTQAEMQLDGPLHASPALWRDLMIVATMQGQVLGLAAAQA